MSSWNWKEFNPKVRQTDKREREGVITKGKKMVEKNLNELGTSSLVCVPEVGLDRTIKNIFHFYPPKSPLETFFKDKENKKFIKGLNKAIEDTQLWTLELWGLKEDAELEDDEEAKTKFNEMLGLDCEESDDEEENDEVKIEKPGKPIFSMTVDEIKSYFGILLKCLYKLESVEKYRLWSKVQDGKVSEKATRLEVYDEKAEEILPRDSFRGTGTGKANIGNKLKTVSAYLLKKYGIDHNRFAAKIPNNYKPVDINFDDFEDLVGTDNLRTKRSKVKALATKKSRVAERSDNDDHEETPQKKKSKSDFNPNDFRTPAKSLQQSVFKTPVRALPSARPSTAATLARPSTAATSARPSTAATSARPSTASRLSFVNLLTRDEADESFGTPHTTIIEEDESEEDDEVVEDDPLIYYDIDIVKPGNVQKAHGGFITTVEICDVEICKSNGFY